MTRTPIGRKMRSEIRSHGDPLLRYKPADLAAAGVQRVTAGVLAVCDGLPLLDDGRAHVAADGIWCTGFKQDFGWNEAAITGEDRWPREERGVVSSAPGLYVTGLAFQYAFSPMLILEFGRDAEHVAKHIIPPRARPIPVGH
jgi:putative flavoprotein involved in K+ transport